MPNEKEFLFDSVELNAERFKEHFGKSMDFKIRQVKIMGARGVFILCDGLCDSLKTAKLVVEPITTARIKAKSPIEHYTAIRDNVLKSVEQKECDTFEDAEQLIMSGFVAFILDGVSRAILVGVQGWNKRSVDQPTNEVSNKGAKECFIEVLNDNVALVRKKLKTTRLRCEPITMGDECKTQIALCYIDKMADEQIIDEVKDRLAKIPVNVVLDFGCIYPYLDTTRYSFFSAVGTTERPDVFCSKILEGRVGIIIDGTPFSIIVPYLITEGFQTPDDYDHKPFYASFIRVLKYCAFIMSIFLPGLYVALTTFHPDAFPPRMLFDVAVASNRTPFPLMLEALIILLIYEVMREAGLQLPKSFGHAISIIGALVIGEATVSAGIIGAPMLIVIALTAISSYIVYPLYEPASILRILFIPIGGLTGVFGIAVGMMVIMVNISSIQIYGVPYTAPIAPFDKKAQKDVILRRSWKTLNKRSFKIQDVKGAVEIGKKV